GRTHDERVRLGEVAAEVHTFEDRAAGHAGRREDHVTRSHLLHGEFPVDVGNAHLGRALDLFAVRGLEAALHLAADAAQCRRRQNALRRTARAEIDVDARLLRIRAPDDARNVAIRNEADARADLADGLDDLGMTRTIE